MSDPSRSLLAAFLLDLAEGIVIGAGLAVLALPDSLTDGRAALLAVIGGGIGGAKTVARAALRAWVDSRKR